MNKYILDLDNSVPVKELCPIIFTNNMSFKLLKLIDFIQKYGKIIKIKYLKNVLFITFEFDKTCQYVNIICYDVYKNIYLRIHLSIHDDPMIKYINNKLPLQNASQICLKPGAYLVHFSHAFISYLGFSRIRLDDDSFLIFKNHLSLEIRIKLWLYLLITKGKSWYSKFGYEPSNCCDYEYQLKISDVRSIKLNKISETLMKIKDFSKDLLEISVLLISLIGDSKETLYEYTLNHSLEDFSELTNLLTQNIFDKNLIIDNNIIEFIWYEKYRQLFLANVLQINNNINKSFNRLK